MRPERSRRPVELLVLLDAANRHRGHVARVALELGVSRSAIRYHRARLRSADPPAWPWPNYRGGTPEHLGPRAWPRQAR